MVDKYDQAAPRHFADAEHLASDQRWDGAGHLIGFAAECAIKHSLAGLQANTHGHISARFLAEAQRHLCGRNSGQWLAVLDQAFLDAWRNWDVGHRYAASGTATPEAYQNWRDQAKRALAAAGLRSQGT